MSSEKKQIARKSLISQTSEALYNKLLNGKLLGISFEVGLEILEERKAKGKDVGDLSKIKKQGESADKKTESKQTTKKVEKPVKETVVKEKKEKVVKEPKEKKWTVNGKTYHHGQKVKMEAASNSELKGKTITGEIVSAFEDKTEDKATVLRIKTKDGKTMLTKKLDKVEFVKD